MDSVVVPIIIEVETVKILTVSYCSRSCSGRRESGGSTVGVVSSKNTNR